MITVGVTTAQQAADIINSKIETGDLIAGDGISLTVDEQSRTVTVSAQAQQHASGGPRVFYPVMLVTTADVLTTPPGTLPPLPLDGPQTVYAIWYVNETSYIGDSTDWGVAAYDVATGEWSLLPSPNAGDIAILGTDVVVQVSGIRELQKHAVLVYTGAVTEGPVRYNWKNLSAYEYGNDLVYSWYSGSLHNHGMQPKAIIKNYQVGGDVAFTFDTSIPRLSSEFEEFIFINEVPNGNGIIFNISYGANVIVPSGKIAQATKEKAVVFARQVADDTWVLYGELDDDPTASTGKAWMDKDNFIEVIKEGGVGTYYGDINFVADGIGAYCKNTKKSLYKFGAAPINTLDNFEDEYGSTIHNYDGGSFSLNDDFYMTMTTPLAGEIEYNRDTGYLITGEDTSNGYVSLVTTAEARMQVDFTSTFDATETGELEVTLILCSAEFLFTQSNGVNGGNVVIHYTDSQGTTQTINTNSPVFGTGTFRVKARGNQYTRYLDVYTPGGFYTTITTNDELFSGYSGNLYAGVLLRKTGGTVPAAISLISVDGYISLGASYM